MRVRNMVRLWPLLLIVLSVKGVPAGELQGDGSRLKEPYLRKVLKVEGITVWIVDGMYIRGNLDEEFTNFGHHYSFPFIPAGEFWLDREASDNERAFYIRHMTVEYRLMAKGAGYDDALEAADSAEAALRIKSGDRKRILAADGGIDTPKVHRGLWRKLKGGVSVWIVDGRLVRSVFFTDFTEGGHDRVYPFVPAGEVWIDDDLRKKERPYVLLHELHERNLMLGGAGYDSAHEESSRLESLCRHHSEELPARLKKEGWN